MTDWKAEYRALNNRVKYWEQSQYKKLTELDKSVETVFKIALNPKSANREAAIEVTYGRWFIFAHDTFQGLTYLANKWLDGEELLNKEED